MDTSWSRTFRELRQRFAAGAAERLAAISSALDRLEVDASDAASLAEVRLRFHGLAGSGATFGFPQVSVLGAQGEHAFDLVAEARRPPTAEEIRSWRNLVEEVREAFRDEGRPVSGEVKALALAAKSADLADVAKSGDLAKIKPAFKELTQVCKSCHDKFRTDD